MKLFNRDSNGFTSEIELGGLPVYTSDLVMLQENSQLFGLYSMLKGWSVILSGCRVIDVNTTTKKVTVSTGYILINNVVYYFNGVVDQTYPFSVRKGSEAVENRFFKDGGLKDTAITYDYAIRTSFTFPSGATYPSDLSTEEIYFDPFTSQKAEYVINNNALGMTEMRFINSSNMFNITRTEANRLITGPALSALTTDGTGTKKYLRWKYFGYQIDSADTNYLKGAGIGPIQIAGSDSIILGKNNIPTHIHGVNINTSTGGNHVHNFTHSGDNSLDNGGKYANARNNPDVYMPWSDMGMIPAGDHNHNVNGNTSDGSADGLKSSPDPLTIQPKYKSSLWLYYQGYEAMSAYHKYWQSGTTNFTNM